MPVVPGRNEDYMDPSLRSGFQKKLIASLNHLYARCVYLLAS
jgi:hypothetical protein